MKEQQIRERRQKYMEQNKKKIEKYHEEKAQRQFNQSHQHNIEW